jgi:hypothetical protein
MLGRYEMRKIIRGGKKTLNNKKKGNGILMWNEREERLSLLYINRDGFLKPLRYMNKHI